MYQAISHGDAAKAAEGDLKDKNQNGQPFDRACCDDDPPGAHTRVDLEHHVAELIDRDVVLVVELC